VNLRCCNNLGELNKTGVDGLELAQSLRDVGVVAAVDQVDDKLVHLRQVRVAAKISKAVLGVAWSSSIPIDGVEDRWRL
jgi:hypothetical protein